MPPSPSTSSPGPLVSAIIATYNRAYIVCEAIDSIIQQSYSNIEIIVVDDGSTDDTRTILKRYGSGISVVCQGNSGPAAAWNAGIKAARGEIICFLGSDDIWLPTFVEQQVRCLEKAGNDAPCSVSNCWLQFADGRGTTSFENVGLVTRLDDGKWMNAAEVLATRFLVFGQTVAIRKNAIDKVGGFNNALRYLEDYDLAFKLAMLGPWGFVREPLVVWRQSAANSLSVEARKENLRVLKTSVATRERVLAGLPNGSEPENLRYLLSRTLRHSYLQLWALQLLENGGRGRKLLGKIGMFSARLRLYWFRRSKFYPKMLAVNFESTELPAGSTYHGRKSGTAISGRSNVTEPINAESSRAVAP
jgi:glycosyltransferase involved in cell wall biosynthesis